MRATNEIYDKLLNHSKNFLEKHSIIKEQGKLFIFVKYNGRKTKVEIIRPSNKNNVLKILYEDPLTTKNGRDSFYAKVREKYANISREYTFNWLKGQENYQLHLIQPRERILRPSSDKKINSKWQIDLIDMSNYSGPTNRNQKWILTVIDVFSKYAWAAEMPNKKAFTIRENLEEILNLGHDITGNYPDIIQSDNGGEFINKDMKYLLETFEIKHLRIPTYLPQANGIIERFNRTLKQMIFSNFTKTGTTKWVDMLQIFIKSYNNSIHTTIKDKPINIHKPDRNPTKQQKLVEKRNSEWLSKSNSYAPLEVGDKVRVHILTEGSERKNLKFAKKYVPQWSKDIYKVRYVQGLYSKKVRPTYTIETGETFYRRDLQKIPN